MSSYLGKVLQFLNLNFSGIPKPEDGNPYKTRLAASWTHTLPPNSFSGWTLPAWISFSLFEGLEFLRSRSVGIGKFPFQKSICISTKKNIVAISQMRSEKSTVVHFCFKRKTNLNMGNTCSEIVFLKILILHNFHGKGSLTACHPKRKPFWGYVSFREGNCTYVDWNKELHTNVGWASLRVAMPKYGSRNPVTWFTAWHDHLNANIDIEIRYGQLSYHVLKC